MVGRRAVALATVLALALTACRGEDPATFSVGEVQPGRVTQTVAAVASLEPEARVEVTAPAGGEVEELLVDDGDVVEAGDPLARLASDTVELQVAQAESAVEAADAFAEAASGAGVDVGPVVGAFRGQLDAVFPPIIDALSDQLGVLEAALEQLQALEVPTVEVPQLPELPERPDRDDLALPDELALPEELELPGDLEELRDLDASDLLDQAPADDDGEGGGNDGEGGGNDGEAGAGSGQLGGTPLVDTAELEAAITDARRRLADTQADYEAAAGELAAVEGALGEDAEAVTEGQAAAADAQREQAELALEAARARIDDLTILAPADGVVELAREGEGAGAGELDGLAEGLPEGLGEGGELDGLADGEGLGDLEGLLGGGAGGLDGPLAEGLTVGPGQTLLTIYDLSSFTARVDVDEIDVVEVEEGQPVTILVDAFPDAELPGRVQHVAISPESSPAGGATYPVRVEIGDVPEDVALRVGLTASAEIEVREVDAATTVPTAALLRRGGDEVVHVVRDGVARAVAVDVLAVGDEDAAVEGDLEVGEVVVTTGVESVEDGTELDLDDPVLPDADG